MIGWTGDKLYIKLTDDGGDGDRLQGIGIAHYEGRELVPYWSTVYSTTAHDSCEIIIPVYAPGIAVYLLSGYWGLSQATCPSAIPSVCRSRSSGSANSRRDIYNRPALCKQAVQHYGERHISLMAGLLRKQRQKHCYAYVARQ